MGKPLGDDDYVISADKEPSIQARIQIHEVAARTFKWKCGREDLANLMEKLAACDSPILKAA